MTIALCIYAAIGLACALIHLVSSWRNYQWDEMTPYAAVGIGLLWWVALIHDAVRVWRDRR